MAEFLKALLGNTPAVVILIIAGLALFVLALVGKFHSPFVVFDELTWWQRLVAFVVAIGLIALVAAAIVPSPPGSMPIGTVVMWWGEGTKEKLPHGFELCDGGWSDILKRDRPNLIERFVRGARAEAKSPADLGGKDDDGKHGIDSYPLPEHEHTIPSHTHGLSTAFAEWGRRSAQRDNPTIYQQGRRGKWKGGIGTGSPLPIDLPEDPAEEAVGTALSGNTDGPSEPLKTNSTTHPMIDNRPRFQEMFFIIKVAD